jgi:hypothetical protein
MAEEVIIRNAELVRAKVEGRRALLGLFIVKEALQPQPIRGIHA